MPKDLFGRAPQNFKGTRDYAGSDARQRMRAIEVTKQVFELFGFEPLETPAIELDRTLSGKYGEEGETRRFRLSSRGDGPDSLGGLRYDHTVPLARYMAMNPNKILPYRRYAIGKVWRNENVQAGRFREFTQCDFDTVGSSSLMVDAEIFAVNYQVLIRLGFPQIFLFQFNDRTLLNAMAQKIGCGGGEQIELFRAWDKMDKVGLDGAVAELRSKKLGLPVVTQFATFTERLQSAGNQYDYLTGALGQAGQAPLATIASLYAYAQALGVPDSCLAFNPLLARGLDYYTGPIMETTIEQSGIGSISGGGRFDKLVAQMGGPDLPASGSSFGLERLLDVMDRLGVGSGEGGKPVFLTVFDQNDRDLVRATFEVAAKLRSENIPVEVYTGSQAKLGKQVDIANRKGALVVLILGPDELSKSVATVKFLASGTQKTVPIAELAAYLGGQVA